MAAGCAARREEERRLAHVTPAERRALARGESPARSLELERLLWEHSARYPRMEAGDLYKLLHQRSLGPGHLVEAGDALAWLQREAAELGALPAGVEAEDVEPLDPARGLARVHLRPWLAQGRPLELLAEAFAKTAARWTPEPERLSAELAAVGSMLRWLGLGVDQAAWEGFTAPLVAQGLPAVHHSETYRAAYAPAYRVVLVALLG